MAEQNDGMVPEVVQPQALEQITRGEADMQVVTAKRFPRDVTKFLSKVRDLALLNADVAASLTYSLPRAGKAIEGSSVRLAEIVASSWGNLKVEQRILGADDKHVTAQATCWDMESNVVMRAEVKRRITNKHGKRYSDDMIVVTGNAAASIAFRNVVFKVVPMVLLDEVLKDADKLCRGDSQSLAEKRTKAVEHFSRFGVTEARVLAVLGRAGVADIAWEDIKLLHGLANAIKEGSTTVEEAFPESLDLTKAGRVDLDRDRAPKTEKPKTEPKNEQPPDDNGMPSDADIEAGERAAIREE